MAEIADATEAGRLVVCLPFLLEAGYSARRAPEHRQLLDELLALPQVHIDDRTEGLALEAQRQLARAGHHRLPPIDLLIAALADRHHLGVLHYDADYEVIGNMTDLSFSSEWLAERDSL